MLPTFIVIGAMKSGTTSLHEYLNLHPEIGMSRRKELDFFKTDEDFSKGLDWYSAQFPNGYRVLGESSPNYAKRHLFPGVPQRIHSVLPDISLIYLVRHPVDRAVSHYVHQLAGGRESRSLEEAFHELDDNPYLQTGAYMYQLHPFLERFPSERILIVDSGELLDDRGPSLARIFRFLGADDAFSSASFSDIHHSGSGKRRSELVDNAMALVPGAARVMSPLLLRLARRSTGKKVERPIPSGDLSRRILNYYDDDITALERFTGRTFAAWRLPAEPKRYG